jgi:hypothetical protein
MPLVCVFHPVYNMRVVTYPEREELVASGQWFNHPNDAKKVREQHEEQIRRESEQGCEHGEHTSKPNGIRTQRKRRVREKGTSINGEHGGQETQPEARSDEV